MKKIFLAVITFFAAVSVFALPKHKDKNAYIFSKEDIEGVYSGNFKLVNKVKDNCKFYLYAYMDTQWFDMGSNSLDGFDDTVTIRKPLAHKLTSLNDFECFAIKPSNGKKYKYTFSAKSKDIVIEISLPEEDRPITVDQMDVGEISEGGAVDVNFAFTNKSDKLIQKVFLTITPYTKDFQVATSKNDNKSTTTLSISNPTKTGASFKGVSHSVWFNKHIASLRVEKVKVVFDDASELEYGY